MSFTDFKDLIGQIAGNYGYSPALMAAQVAAESAFNPDAKSPVGAMGLTQFMPATWQDWGNGGDPFDPAANLDANARYMGWLLGQLDGAASQTELALAAYNWGIGHVKRLVSDTGRSDWAFLKPHMPQETQAYVDRIMGRLDEFKLAFGIAAAGLGAGAIVLLALLGMALFKRFA